MENQINVGDQNTQQIGQNPISQPVTQQEKPKVNYWMISTIILSLVLVTFVGVFALNLRFQRRTAELPTATPTKSPADSSLVVPSNFAVSPSPASANRNWKSFHFLCSACNGYPNYTIQHPTDWVLEEKVGGGSITLSKSSYEIFIQEPWAGYDRCLYSDSKPFEGPSVKFGNFVEIETSDGGVLRRPQSVSQDNQLTLCGQSAEGDFYTVSKYGTIKYLLPNNVDPLFLNAMDNITETLKLDSQK